MTSGAPHFSLQSEERVHDILVGNIDYSIDFSSGKSSFFAYLAAQKTERDHYTGVRPEIGSDDDTNGVGHMPQFAGWLQLMADY